MLKFWGCIGETRASGQNVNNYKDLSPNTQMFYVFFSSSGFICWFQAINGLPVAQKIEHDASNTEVWFPGKARSDKSIS